MRKPSRQGRPVRRMMRGFNKTLEVDDESHGARLGRTSAGDSAFRAPRRRIVIRLVESGNRTGEGDGLPMDESSRGDRLGCQRRQGQGEALDSGGKLDAGDGQSRLEPKDP